ncbi:MAG: site-2 protease family protein [Bacteroidales bacterium]
MKYSLSLGKPFGIKIAVHWTFLLLIIWIVAVNVQQGANTAQIIMSILFILALFVCVTLHELGHSLAARRYGIETRSITLLPIGGMANIDDMPEKPKQEIVVTLSGLVVNVAIALLLWAVISIIPGYTFDTSFQSITSENFLILLMYINLFIVAFNLIPAFPMDGGRILRAALSFRMERIKATKYSMMAGQVFGVIFALIGLFVNPFLFVIGLFVVIGARMEYTQVKFSSLLVDYKAQDIVMDDYSSLDQEEPLKNAVDLLLKSAQTGFLVKEGDEVVGILSKNDIISGLSKQGEDAPVKDSMTTGFKHVEAGTPLRDIFKTLQREKTDILPVFREGKLIGVIDQDNIQEFIMVQSALKEA